MVAANRLFLSFCVNFLQILNLWPTENNSDYIDDNWRLFKDASLILSLMPCALPILADFVLQLYDGVYNLVALTENLIALNCIIGMIYMTVCFVKHRRLIQRLVVNLNKFQQFNSADLMIETDASANLYAKLFIFYGIVGNIVYMIMPYMNMDKCREIKAKQTIDDGVPCGLVTRCRLPFQFDYSPVFEIVFIHQFYTCTMVSVVILVLTMLLCGLLMHITNQLNHLRSYITELAHCPNENLMKKVHCCITYHIAIITYSEETNEAFSDMMMLHLTLTSLVISGLCFEILIVDNFNDSLRFTLHLLGWLVLLLLVCYYGQIIVDESILVAHDIYFTPWYNTPVKVQKDIYMMLMRSQKPLTLSAANMGIMSLPTFLKVISSAYSYFTLLLNIKP